MPLQKLSTNKIYSQHGNFAGRHYPVKRCWVKQLSQESRSSGIGRIVSGGHFHFDKSSWPLFASYLFRFREHVSGSSLNAGCEYGVTLKRTPTFAKASSSLAIWTHSLSRANCTTAAIFIGTIWSDVKDLNVRHYCLLGCIVYIRKYFFWTYDKLILWYIKYNRIVTSSNLCTENIHPKQP